MPGDFNFDVDSLTEKEKKEVKHLKVIIKREKGHF